jgi:VWFA-related protein
MNSCSRGLRGSFFRAGEDNVRDSRFFLAIAVVLTWVTLASAQNPDDHDYSVSVNVELVQLSVSVLDKHGYPVQGLEKQHFAVYEDKVLQDISLFKQEDIPLSVGLVVDMSSSMFDKLHSVSSAAMTFVRESNPQDETAIVTFSNFATLEQDFTTNTHALSRALSGIVPLGNTALYDAVLLAARHLRDNGMQDKKVLIVISDGQDNDSKYQLKHVMEALKESKIIVYSIGLLGPDSGNSNYTNMLEDDGKKALKQLAEVTGGSAFFPSGVREVERVCRRIARDLRNQYTIGYKPSNDKLDGSWRKTLVRVNAPKGFPGVKVRTKQGYYAPVTHDTSLASAGKKLQ